MSATATAIIPTRRSSQNKKIKRTRFIDEEVIAKVFKEKDIQYSTGVETKVHSINKTFLFPDVVARLNSTDPEKRNKALSKLIDWLDHKNALTSGQYQTEEIVDNTTRLFQRLKRYGMKHDFVEEEKVLHLLEILSAHLKSAKLIASKTLFIKELYKILYNVQSEHQEPAAKILYNITNNQTDFISFFVKANKPFKEIEHIFNRPIGTLYYPKYLWLHLAKLIEAFPVTGVKHGFFDVCYNRIINKMPAFHLENLLCLTALLKSKKGLELFKNSEMMSVLLELVSNGSPANMNFEYVLKCLNEALNDDELQQMCVPYPDLPLQIVDIARKSKNPSIQYYCVDIVGKLYLIQPFDQLIHDKCIRFLRNMKPSDELVECGSRVRPRREADRVLRILELASASPKSAEVMASNASFVTELYAIIEKNKSSNQDQAANILSNLTDHDKDFVRKFYNKNGSFGKMKQIFEVNDNRTIFPRKLWVHLSHLIRASPPLGLKYGFFDICLNNIKNETPDFENGPTLCLASSLGTKKCFQLFEKSGVMPILLNFLADRKNRLHNFQYVLMCLNEALRSEKLHEEFFVYPDLPATLIEIAGTTRNPEVHLTTIQIIRKLYLVPPFDVAIHKCTRALKKLKVNEELAEYEKQEFLNFLQSRQKLYKLK